ncbi:MAG: flagellar filament capping protein FliD [Lachnospiraceae bacterium]|nr:flagellar filament capping protein FliD [Lachnospiraceae bacterium]
MSIRITGMNSGMDTDAMVQELVKSYSKKTETLKKEQTKAEWKQEAWTDLNKKIKSFSSKYVSNMQYSTFYSKKTTNVSDDSKVSVVTGDNAVSGTQTIEVNKLAKSGYLTGGQLSTTNGKAVNKNTTLADLGYTGEDTQITLTKGDGKTISIDVTGSTKLSTITDALSGAGLNANLDTKTGRLFISSKDSGAKNNFTLTASTADGNDALAKLGLQEEKYYKDNNITVNENAYAKKIDGQDAEILLNGAKFTSANNAFSINGLTITAKDVTQGEVTLSTDTDYDSIYDSIKGFIKDYGELIKSLDKAYNGDSAKGYEPLTAEEKDALTDEEVEKWETKIKESLLRRDQDVSSVASIMKEAMASTYTVKGEVLSLSSFGINTLGYFNAPDNEKNVFHIDGDKDDEATSGNTDKLKAAIAQDPAKVASFFQKLATNMYDSFQKITRSSSTRSYGSFFDDKKVKKEYESYEGKISDWEDYVAKIEDKYYAQFSKMETAMAKLNNTQSYLSNVFGM